MARNRSPNYPAMKLEEALEAIDKIYSKDMKNKMSRDAVSQHLGYKSSNGRSLVKIAAIKAYGLLDGVGDNLRVTERSVNLIAESKGSDMWIENLCEAAFEPKVFNELNAHYEGGRPSPENLRSELIRRCFTPDAVDKVISVYLDNYDLVTQYQGGYTVSTNTEKSEPELKQEAPMVQPQRKPPQSTTKPAPTGFEAQNDNDIKFLIDSGKLRISALVNKEGLKKLKKIIEANEAFIDE